MQDFDFKRVDALAPTEGETTVARAYLARVAEEDGAALVGHVALVRRAVSQICADCFFDLTANLRAVNPAAAEEVRAELENLILGSQRLGTAAHALDVAATRAHWAAYECAPAQAQAPKVPKAKGPREAAPAPARAQTQAQHEAEMGDEWQPDLMEGEFSRDEDARDIGQDLPDEPPASVPVSAPLSGRVAAAPALADLPKIPVTAQGNEYRRQLWAVVNKAGLSSSPAQRDARLKAISARLGREVISINTLIGEEWESVISGVEYQSLVW